MAIAIADRPNQAVIPVSTSTTIRVLLVHNCPLFRVGLHFFLAQQSDCHLIDEATSLEDELTLAREQRPDIVLRDGGLTSADPLEMTYQLRKAGVPGILVFAPLEADEEMLFQFVRHGAAAFEFSTISGEDLLAKMHRVALGEYLVTGDVLIAQVARRARLASMRQDMLLAVRSCVAGPASPLSQQEQEILEQIARGCGSTERVAQALGISAHLVKNRMSRLMKKLHVYARTSAVITALRNKWITL